MRIGIYMACLIGELIVTGQNTDSLTSRLPLANGPDSLIILKALTEAQFTAGNYPASLEYRYMLIENAEKTGKDELLPEHYFEAGRCHYYMRTNDISNKKALKLIRKAYHLAGELGDSTTRYRSARGLGAILGERRQYDSSFYYLASARQVAQARNDLAAVSGILIIEATYHIEQDSNMALAGRKFAEAIRVAKQSSDREALAYALLANGGHRLNLGRYPEAEEMIREANKIQTELGSMDGMLNTLAALSNLYRRMNKLNEYVEVSVMYQDLKDSVYNQATTRAMMEAQEKYEAEKREQAIATLEAEAELKDRIILQNRYLLVLVALALVLSVVLTLNYFRKRTYKLKAQMAIEKADLQRSRFSAVIEAEENERKRIAQELHDGLGQLLSAARLSISSLDDEETNRKVQNSLKLMDSTVGEVRSISHNLMPRALTKSGLVAALQEQIRRIEESGKTRVISAFDQEPDLTDSHKSGLYRITQELLNNILKYAEAEEIKISLQASATHVELEVQDNGKGFDVGQIEKSRGIGWRNIQSRVEVMNGELDIYSKLEAGTRVKISIPK